MESSTCEGCTNCGHQGAPGMAFCLNCGTRLGPPRRPSETQQGAVGLPAAVATPVLTPVATPLPPIGSAPTTPVVQNQSCPGCNADNAPGMRFCRQCGTGLNMSPQPSVPPRVQPRPATPTPPPGAIPAGSSQPYRQPPRQEPERGTRQCTQCGGQTPGGFSFCQRCGKPLTSQTIQTPYPTPTPRTPTPRTPTPRTPTPRTPTPRALIPLATPAWAAVISVNRDGSDGQVHELRGDYVELGRSASVDLHFDDPYLAECHARIERLGAGGARILPLDPLNGVFRRIRQDTQLIDGAIILVGRELLRFNLLKQSESRPAQLVQHGVAMFGSPLREAWGRISQILPSGGVRDVRHLHGGEVVFGREEGDVVFSDDEFLSRRHAAFCWRDGHCVLSDLGSSNGTFIRIIESANLSDGDFLRIGDQMLRFKPR